MSIKLVAAALAPLLGMATPSLAQDASVAATEISTGAFAKAEQKLLGEMRANPRPEVLLNLAAVYYGTGRLAEAGALYRQVLAQDDVMLDLSNQRTAGSHSVARAGLRYLDLRQRTALR